MIVNELEIISKSFEPITTDLLAKHLNLDEDFSDLQYLDYLIEAGVDWCESRSNSFITTTVARQEIFDFTGDLIFIDKGGIKSIESIKVNDLPVTGFKLIRRHNSTMIKLDEAVSTLSYVEVTLNAGGSTIKKNLIHACIIKAADLYDTDRSDYSSGLNNNNTVLRLLNLM